MLANIMLWPLAVFFVLVVLLVCAILLGSHFLGSRHTEPATGAPYESGIVSQGSARVRFGVQYNMIAMFFVVFDLEAAFLFAWAVSAKQSGWRGYAEVVVFTGVLIIGLIYLARAGGLDWAPRSRRRGEQ